MEKGIVSIADCLFGLFGFKYHSGVIPAGLCRLGFSRRLRKRVCQLDNHLRYSFNEQSKSA